MITVDSSTLHFSLANAETPEFVSTSDTVVQWPEDSLLGVNGYHVLGRSVSVTGYVLFRWWIKHVEFTPLKYKLSLPEFSHSGITSLKSYQDKTKTFSNFWIMLTHSLQCSSLILEEDIEKKLNERSHLLRELSCSNGSNYRWQSQAIVSGTKGEGNLTSSVLFSGIHFAIFEKFCNNLNLKTIT